MERPNLFAFATKELTQDAVICWILSWADRKHRATDEPLHLVGVTLLRRLLSLTDIDPTIELETLKIERQFKNIDILVLINEDIALIIEDKTNSGPHSDQLLRYRENIQQEHKNRKVAAVFFKTGEQCDYSAIRGHGYGCFLRRDFLDVLNHGAKLGIKNDIFTDYYSYLRTVETAVASYQHTPYAEWKMPHPWAGFFTALREKLGDGGWGFVANPSGGFMGFWWHGRGITYLQLEEGQLKFKIKVDDKSLRAAEWHVWYGRLTAAAKQSELELVRPSRRKNGTSMTVAILKGHYIQSKANSLDMDQTVEMLKKAEQLLDSAAAS